MTPIQTILAVLAVRGKLVAGGSDRLTMWLPRDVDPQLKAEIRANKAALIEVLKLPAKIVRSDTLGIIVFWAADEPTKEALIQYGADPAAVYTTAEITVLVKNHVTPDQLVRIHTARDLFHGRIVDSK
ncbi:MAG TPA: hypothetical protein PKW32_09830 [Verrucomicrobiota bacterium]|nr:hypothetical protein [Verrucomicrobiota bacterium]